MPSPAIEGRAARRLLLAASLLAACRTAPTPEDACATVRRCEAEGRAYLRSAYVLQSSHLEQTGAFAVPMEALPGWSVPRRVRYRFEVARADPPVLCVDAVATGSLRGEPLADWSVDQDRRIHRGRGCSGPPFVEPVVPSPGSHAPR